MSNPDPTVPDTQAELDTLFACLADSDRRELLATLYETAEKLPPLEELALSLIDTSSGQDRDEKRQKNQVLLTHTHLPKLEHAGLITYTDQGIVERSPHPVYEDEAMVEMLTNCPGADAALDALFRALSDSRRRITLNIVRFQSEPLALEALAREIGAIEADTSAQSVSDEQVAKIRSSLQHTHLPILADTGLIEYTDSEGTVSYDQTTEIRDSWIPRLLTIPHRMKIQL